MQRLLLTLWWFGVLCRAGDWHLLTASTVSGWRSGEAGEGDSIVTLAPSRGVGFETLVIDFEACTLTETMSTDMVYIYQCNTNAFLACTSVERFLFAGAKRRSFTNSATAVVKIRIQKYRNGCKLNNRLTISYKARLFDANNIWDGAQFPRDCFKWGTSLLYPYGTTYDEKTDTDAQGKKYYALWKGGNGNWVDCPANSCMWGTRDWVGLGYEWYNEKNVYGVKFSEWYMDEWCACMPGFYASTSAFATTGEYANDNARPPGKCFTKPAAHDKIVCKECMDGYYCPGGASFSDNCPIKCKEEKGVTTCNLDCESQGCTFMTHTQPIKWTTCGPGWYVDPQRPGTKVQDRRCLQCGKGTYSDSENLLSCKNCDKGKYADSLQKKECSLCDYGKYSDEYAQFECKPCVAGKYYDNLGGTTCKDCEFGKSTALDAATQAWVDWLFHITGVWVPPKTHPGKKVCTAWTKCDDGKFSDPAPSATQNRNCKDCLAGKFRVNTWHDTEDPEQKRCFDWQICKPGTYTERDGTASSDRACTSCQAGKYQPNHGQRECTLCTNGLGSEKGATACKPCGASKYALPETGVCTPCPQGTFWNNTNTANSACTPCTPGTYSDPGQSTCFQCNAGFYSNPPKIGCTPCGPGQFGDNQGQSRCKDCPAGKFSNGTVNTGCPYTCQPGSYAEARASACTICPPGTYSSTPQSGQCAQCNKGTYSNSTGATSVATCQECVDGTYADGTGMSSCKQCGNDYALIGKEVGCQSIECGLGLVPLWRLSKEQQGRIVAGTPCAVCYALDSDSYEGAPGTCTQCPPCNQTEYRRIAGNQLSNCQYRFNRGVEHCLPCQVCRLGVSYYVRNCSGTQPSACATCSPPCAAHEYETQNCTLHQDRNCTACRSTCPDGEYMVSPCNATADMQCAPCRDCESGWYTSTPCQQRSNRNCTICGPGTFAQAKNQPLCVKCGNGTFAARAGSSRCSACAAGTYIAEPGSTVCKICSNGTFSVREGVSSCTACAAGWFLSNSTIGRCELCPAGTYSPYGGSTDCELCQPGSFSPVPSVNATNTQCPRCQRGHYSAGPKAPACTPCAPGTFSSDMGSTTCTPCAAGKFAASLGMSTCLQCGPGNFSSAQGTSQCTRCPIGTRSDAPVESTGCQACQPGTYASTTGQSACLACASACVFGARYESVNCTPVTNRVCSTCSKRLCPLNFTSNVSRCLPSGFFDCVPCPAFGNDNVHLIPEYSCATCPRRDCGLTPGTYLPWRTACSPLKSSYMINDTYTCARCKGCRYRQYVNSWSSCDGKGGSLFELNPDNSDLCVACEISCKPGQYIANLCNGRVTQNTEVCVDCASCPYGHYHAKPLRGSMHPAFDGDPWLSGYVEDVPCSGIGILKSDGVSDCERCDTCPFGKYASDVRRCTGNGIWKDPFNCTDCKPCPSGYEHVAPCDGLSFNDSCKLCPACPVGFHTVSSWNNALKRMSCGCKRCLDSDGDVCPIHFFKTNATCSGNKPYDEACSPCSLCNSGEYISEGAFCTGATYKDTSAGKCR